MLKNAYRTVAVLGVCAAVLTGCKKKETASSGGATPSVAFNASCPIQPEKGVSLRAPTVMYKGTVIGFCCSDCPAKWEEWPESKKDEFVAAQKKALAEQMPKVPGETPDH